MSDIDRIAIDKPCAALWEEMSGDDRARFCRLCSKLVYDTTALETCELERMLALPKPPCVRVHRGADGRVLTRDRIAKLALGAALALTAACGTSDDLVMGQIPVPPTGTVEVTRPLLGEPAQVPPQVPPAPPVGRIRAR